MRQNRTKPDFVTQIWIVICSLNIRTPGSEQFAVRDSLVYELLARC